MLSEYIHIGYEKKKCQYEKVYYLEHIHVVYLGNVHAVDPERMIQKESMLQPNYERISCGN